MPLHFVTRDVCIIITLIGTEIEDFEINFQSSRALSGFGSAEMPPVLLGGKGNSQAPYAEGISNGAHALLRCASGLCLIQRKNAVRQGGDNNR